MVFGAERLLKNGCCNNSNAVARFCTSTWNSEFEIEFNKYSTDFFFSPFTFLQMSQQIWGDENFQHLPHLLLLSTLFLPKFPSQLSRVVSEIVFLFRNDIVKRMNIAADMTHQGMFLPKSANSMRTSSTLTSKQTSTSKSWPNFS